MIERIIHYCWLSENPIPDELKAYMRTWSEKLEGYTFIKWDFSKFDKESSVWVKEAFDNKKYAFAADYIRLYALYSYGGIYLDVDIEVLKSFDDLLNRRFFLAYESPDKRGIEAACMGFEKGNSYLGKCLDYYTGRHFIKSNGEYDTTPLPRIMMKVAQQNNIELDLFNWQTFTCKSFETGLVKPLARSYTIHHFAGSWLDKKLQKELEIKRRIISKYTRHGNLLFKLYKYGLHPWRIIDTIKIRMTKG